MTRNLHREAAPIAIADDTGGGPSTEPGPRLAGYRVLRAASERHGGRGFHAARDDPSGTRIPATIVVFDGDGGEDRAMRLIERSEILAGESIPRVLDVCLGPEGQPSVVLDSCGDPLSSIMSAGARLRAGEVVTIAAPILTALSSIHDRGFVHGSVSAASIAIGSDGRPVLLGCERSTDLRPLESRSERARAAGDDLRAFADLIVELGDAVVDTDARRRVQRAAETIRVGADTPFSSSVRSEAEVRLFEIADSAPLSFLTDDQLVTDSRLDRAARAFAPTDTRRRRDRGRPGRSAIRSGVAIAVRSVADQVARRVPLRVSETAAVLARRWRAGGRPKRVAVAALSGLSAAIALLILIPSGETVSGEPRAETGSIGAAAPSAGTDSTRPASRDAVGSSAPSIAPGDASAGGTQIDAEDAVAGMRAALDVLSRCAIERVAACWDDVFEPGSALLATTVDRGADDLPAALAVPVEGLDIEQREDFGDARLITIRPRDETKPASVLIVRTEAGWRIREVFET